MKKCTKCGEEKPRTEFYTDIRNSDGLLGCCKACKSEYERQQYLKNNSLIIKRARIWAKQNPERVNEYKTNWVRQNPEKRREARNKWAKNNPEKVSASKKRRQEALVRATPPWLTKEQILEIAFFYKNCPKGFSVDHEIPVQGIEVSGLNVIWNMRYLPTDENSKKGNKFKPYTEVFGNKKVTEDK